ncbi:MAG: hypothetical protein U0174_26780 [Polyangiaceae bacterium]
MHSSSRVHDGSEEGVGVGRAVVVGAGTGFAGGTEADPLDVGAGAGGEEGARLSRSESWSDTRPPHAAKATIEDNAMNGATNLMTGTWHQHPRSITKSHRGAHGSCGFRSLDGPATHAPKMIDADLITEHLLTGRARARMLEQYRDGKSWDVDLASGWMRIGDASCRVQLLGTFSLTSGSFLWGWANPSASQWQHSLACCTQLKERGGDVFGVAKHTEPDFSIPALGYVSAELCGGRPLFFADHREGTVYLMPEMPIDLSSISLAYLPGVLLEYAELAGHRAPPPGPATKRFLERMGFSVTETVDASDEEVTHLRATRGSSVVSARIDWGALEAVDVST